MIFITDIDDTVLQSADMMQHYFEVEHGMKAETPLRDVHNIPMLYDIDLPTTLDLIAQFHRSRYMEMMEPMTCALQVLPELHRMGYRFVAVTACLNEPEVVEARRRNLERVFGFAWTGINCLGLTHCKRDALASYPRSLWADDLAHHAMAGAEAGHRSFLINKKYNQDAGVIPDVRRVDDWHEIMDHLTSDPILETVIE